jgi:putative PIG3 family NAD(P)H quinone oxidoreductase
MSPNIPDKMKVIEITRPGGPEVLVVAQRAVPNVGDHEVLIEVAASGLNGADIPQREGRSAQPRGAQDILGLEVSGIIRRMGRAVHRWRLGDRVCALVEGGGYAEYCVAPEGQCLPIPAELSLIEAASLPEATMTVWANVFEHAGLKAGETLLVHGGASGVGTTAIQTASRRGARVVATAGSDQKCTFCESIGAERSVNYRNATLSDALLDASSGNGYDVILDIVGASNLSMNMRLLRHGGRQVIIATKGGHEAAIDLKVIQDKQLLITGSRLRPRAKAEKSRIREQVEKHIWPLYGNNKLRPVIDSTYPLEKASDAHARLQSGFHIGKILLRVGNDAGEICGEPERQVPARS